MGNSIAIIIPYFWEGSWVFDDDAIGVVREPFLCNADTMITQLVLKQQIPDAENGFRLLFSSEYFPGYQARYEWVRSEGNGNWYRSTDEEPMEGWLCGTMFSYFKTVPQSLYVKVEPRYRGVDLN